MGYSPWGHKESDTTEVTNQQQSREAEGHFQALPCSLAAGFSSSPLGFSQRASRKIAPSRPNDEREKTNAVF